MSQYVNSLVILLARADNELHQVLRCLCTRRVEGKLHSPITYAQMYIIHTLGYMCVIQSLHTYVRTYHSQNMPGNVVCHPSLYARMYVCMSKKMYSSYLHCLDKSIIFKLSFLLWLHDFFKRCLELVHQMPNTHHTSSGS